MEYILIIILICGIVYYLIQKNRVADLKENGIKVTGTIIYNGETKANSNFRLGGNINTPTIKFVTEDGQEIIGKPVSGFISQHEIKVPASIDIIYDSRNPQRFCVDLDY